MSLAKRLIIIGSALIVLSAILTVVVPAIGYSLWGRVADQGTFIGFELMLRFVGDIVPPLGASLLAAGIVVFCLQRKSSSASE